MMQRGPGPRFSHKLSQLQQARLQGEITGEEYKEQLTEAIEEETHSDEEVNQSQRRAYLWTQADDTWKQLEAEKAAKEQQAHDKQVKDQQEKERQIAMQSEQAETEKLQPFTEYIQKIMSKELPEMRKSSRNSRRLYNILQGLIIIASAVASIIVNLVDLPRWYTSIATGIILIASGFLALYKLKDRSTTLQQTGDLMEAEYEAFTLELDEYEESNTVARHKLLTRRLKRLKEEQRNRELLLEQSPENSKQNPSGAQA